MDLTKIIPIIGVLVALTNIIVQVLKKATWDKLPTNVLALVIAMLLCLVAGIAYCQVNAISITWYLVAALIVLGFLVAYAAMFGFDKLQEIMKWKKVDA
ncbi:MAG: hypothetical protein IIW96_07550 [Oscillibacter sp.]|nr:hypothetical protein [Oscillibacter sp.]